MARMGKYLTLFLVVILSVSSYLMVIPTNAQNIPKPSVPEFKVEFVNSSVLITIKNQPFTSQILNGETTHLYFQIQSKLHNSQNWTIWYYLSDLVLIPTQSNSSLTAIEYSWDGSYLHGVPTHLISMPNNTEVDIQIQAMNGYIDREIIDASKGAFGVPYVFNGMTSDWSNQTITIPVTNTASPSPTVPEFPITASMVAVLVAVSLLFVIGQRKQVSTVKN